MSVTAEMETYDWKKNPRGPGVLCPFADRHRGGNFKPCITESKSWTLRGVAILHATRACQANFRFPAMFKFPDADPFRVNDELSTDCRKDCRKLGVDDSNTKDEDDHGTNPNFVDVDLTAPARPAQASKPVAATPTSVPATPANDIGSPGSSKRIRQEGLGPSDKRPRAATGVASPSSANAAEARQERLRRFNLMLEQPHVKSALKALKDLKDLPYVSTRTARMELVASLDKDLEAAIRLTGTTGTTRDNKPAMETMSEMRGHLASISKREDLLNPFKKNLENSWMNLIPTTTEWNETFAYLQRQYDDTGFDARINEKLTVFPGVESFFESSLAMHNGGFGDLMDHLRLTPSIGGEAGYNPQAERWRTKHPYGNARLQWKALHDNLLSEWRKIWNDFIA